MVIIDPQPIAKKRIQRKITMPDYVILILLGIGLIALVALGGKRS